MNKTGIKLNQAIDWNFILQLELDPHLRQASKGNHFDEITLNLEKRSFSHEGRRQRERSALLTVPQAFHYQPIRNVITLFGQYTYDRT